jgi:hypothetical protein
MTQASSIAQVIDSKTESHDYVVEKVSTTLTLLETAPDQFGMNYNAAYSGIFGNGNVQGGPIPVSGNGQWNVHDGPRITVSVSNYSDDTSNRIVSMHVTINVDVLGGINIFDQTLGGKYGIGASWGALAEAIRAAKAKAA